MALETGTFIDDLVTTNPPGGDDKRQGDDHLRLIKNVLKNSIKRVSRAFYVPSSVVKNANYTVLASDDNMTFLCDTTSSFTLTLPTLTSTDKGWAIYITKTTSDGNPVFITPPSGSIFGVSKIRRSIYGQITKILWTGTEYMASRPNGLPIGTILDFYGSALPQGHLYANGGTFVAANYVELNALLGTNVLPDLRGRVAVGVDNMGGLGAAGRLGSIITPTLGTGGGVETVVLSGAQLPAHTHTFTTGTESALHSHSGTTATENQAHNHSGTTGGQSNGHTHTFSGTTSADGAHVHSYTQSQNQNQGGVAGGGGLSVNSGVFGASTSFDGDHSHSYSGTTSDPDQGHVHGFNTGNENQAHDHNFGTGTESALHTHSGTTNSSGSSSAVGLVQPSLIVNKIVVVE
jgi:microcystin-dependent protein